MSSDTEGLMERAGPGMRRRVGISYERVLEQLPEAAYLCDADGLLTYFNHRAFEVFGRAPLLNDPADRWAASIGVFTLEGEPIPLEERPLSQALRTGKDYLRELVIERANGERFVARAHATPVLGEDGRIAGAMTVLIDISERKRLEDTMRFLAEASAELGELSDYETTLERISRMAVPGFADWCGVMVRDAGGAFRRIAVHHANPARVQAVEELFQRYPPQPSDDYGAMRVLRVGEPLFVPRVTDEILRAIARDADHLRMLTALKMRSYICVPMRSRRGMLGTLTFVTAESGRTYVESHLRAAEDLAHRAAIAIENAQLLQALRDADRRKDEFLAMLAHELRNPLAPVRNAVQILRSTESGGQAGWAHDVIDRQVKQMARLVDDLLDVSRITMGKIELRKAKVAIANVISAAVEAAKPLIERARHNLTVHMPDDAVYVMADHVRLAQIVSNLLNNAAKYTEPGGRIGLVVERSGAYEVAIHVVDTGAGIPRDMLDRVFEMFTQVDRAADQSHGGLGIGLTLVKSLAEMHGGSVQALSDGPGKGSEFIVRLPALPDDVTGSYPRLRPIELAQGPGQRVLVVDDNRDAADSLAMLLRAAGHDVRVAYDGLEAVGAAIAFRPHVVLLDIGLPKLYGYEVARKIRESRGAEVLLIAVTGWGQEEDRARSREAGFDHHLTKPVDFDEVRKLLVPLAR